MTPHKPLSEAPQTTHDGTIWPVARADMNQRDHIITRMAQDVLDLHRIGDEPVLNWQLESLGWTAHQVRFFGEHSAVVAKDKSKANRRKNRSGFVETVATASAWLTLSCVAALLFSVLA